MAGPSKRYANGKKSGFASFSSSTGGGTVVVRKDSPRGKAAAESADAAIKRIKGNASNKDGVTALIAGSDATIDAKVRKKIGGESKTNPGTATRAYEGKYDKVKSGD